MNNGSGGEKKEKKKKGKGRELLGVAMMAVWHRRIT
jgi:hypothetical protein